MSICKIDFIEMMFNADVIIFVSFSHHINICIFSTSNQWVGKLELEDIDKMFDDLGELGVG